MKSIIGEIVISIVLIILLVLLANPMNFWMPNHVHMLMLAALAIVFILFAGFIWKEKVQDERENLHRYVAARFGYLAGLTLLIVAVIVQSLQHVLDVWIVYALGAMILAKVIGFLYSSYKH